MDDPVLFHRPVHRGQRASNTPACWKPWPGHLLKATGGDLKATGLGILWSSALLSAVVDNIPFVATMIPMVKAMAPAFGGPDGLMPLWWALSLGACLGGNGTLIGASANLTVAGIAERNGIPFRFLTFTKHALPMMIVHLAHLPRLLAVSITFEPHAGKRKARAGIPPGFRSARFFRRLPVPAWTRLTSPRRSNDSIWLNAVGGCVFE